MAMELQLQPFRDKSRPGLSDPNHLNILFLGIEEEKKKKKKKKKKKPGRKSQVPKSAGVSSLALTPALMQLQYT